MDYICALYFAFCSVKWKEMSSDVVAEIWIFELLDLPIGDILVIFLFYLYMRHQAETRGDIVVI